MEETGYQLLHDPRKNKGTAFTLEEREKFGLDGLVPSAVESIETQLIRVHEQVDLFQKPINKYIYLLQLLETNETLFYKTIMDDPQKYLPLVYTPTVGEACEEYGHILRRPKGIFISIDEKDNIKQILANWPEKDVRVTVVTDGERILGLGDLGACGMGIPIGKLCLYTACAGVPPEYTLPVLLDAGTNNKKFIEDPLYTGLKRPRVHGKEYDDFIEAFVQAATEVFPKICIQWEDFAAPDAAKILQDYKERICTFNDDIQGTAGVATAGIIAAARFTGKPFKEQRFLFLGAGSAATGIGDLLRIVLEEEMSHEEAMKHVWLFNTKGLVVKSRTDLRFYQQPFAQDYEQITNFVEAIERIKPTAIIGVSTMKGAFNREVIEAMSRLNERPIIFPFSNPTSRSECTAEEAYTWSDGRAIVASGSPFDPVTYKGKTYVTGQGNNVFIFPAVGLAIFATEAKRVTDDMMLAAARSLAKQVTQENFDSGLVYPSIRDVLAVETEVAIDVAKLIFEKGLAEVEQPEDLREFITSKMYQPEYQPLPVEE